ncbi:NAD-dependent epimerase/dehydratase family protein [Algiphilus sp.]|uniref:NAD-dependent epimerase/dehydratase family protein n=1 Tax=Algiphilus sp. TaxID=1872431 RepID=UPI003BA8E0D0
MKVVVTGSAGHLGEGLVRVLSDTSHQVVSVDRVASPYTSQVGSITDRAFVRKCLKGADAVMHAATLHKPHVATHSRQAFVDTNMTGTLNLLEEAVEAGVASFVFTSTTSVFGRALTPAPEEATAWITEDVRPVPKNIYGVTKAAAEDLCELFHRQYRLPCLILRTSRFFLEEDDDPGVRARYPDANIKVNEYLYRRVDLQDVVDAHLLAMNKAKAVGFGRFIISATTPFQTADLTELRAAAPRVVQRYVPEYQAEYARRGWAMFPGLDRVYVNASARQVLGWQPRYDFRRAIDALQAVEDFRSPLARAVGVKGYHHRSFEQGPYPVA